MRNLAKLIGLRTGGKWLLVSTTVFSGVMCVLNDAPWLAIGQWLAAFTLALSRFGRPTESSAFDALHRTLREAYRDDKQRLGAIRATVTSTAVFVAAPIANRAWWRRSTVAFRDEVDADRWREVVTALRHQRRSADRLSSNRKFGER